jgi:hypothetical protein
VASSLLAAAGESNLSFHFGLLGTCTAVIHAVES